MNPVTIVMYHYVRNIRISQHPGIKGLEYEDFLAQLKYLKKHYVPITIEDLVNNINDLSFLPKKSILLTFDDAYLDHFNYVYPALKKHGIQGSFYAPVKAVAERCVLDVNKIHFILASCENINDLLRDFRLEYNKIKLEYSLESFDSYYSKHAISNRFDSAEVIFFKRSLQALLPEDVRKQITNKLFLKHVGIAEESFSDQLYMNKTHLEHLINDGMHVGSHGYDHYWWSKLPEDMLDAELDKSIDFLNSISANNQVMSACYPYGSWSQSVVDKLEDKGFDIAFTTEVDLLNSRHSKLLVPRLDTNDIPKSVYSKVNSWHPDSHKQS